MRKLLHGLRVLVSLFLFIAALWILREVVREYRFHEIVRELRSIPPVRLGASLGLTAAAYLALVGYDVVAVRYLGRRLGFRRILPVSFIVFAVSNSAPVSLLTGGGLRYRLYGNLGLTSVEIAELVAFDVVTYVVGLFITGGIVFLFEPLAIPGSLHLHFPPCIPWASSSSWWRGDTFSRARCAGGRSRSVRGRSASPGRRSRLARPASPSSIGLFPARRSTCSSPRMCRCPTRFSSASSSSPRSRH